MRVRLALTLFVGLVLALLAIPAGAQPADSSTGVDDALHVGRPRAAIVSVFHSAAEAFLAFDGGTSATPVPVLPGMDHLGLVADYEAVFSPLTAGFAEFDLHVWQVVDDGRELLGEDAARVVAFGPFKRAGRLKALPALTPGLHHLVIEIGARSRAVGVADWTEDADVADLWVLVAPSAVAAADPVSGTLGPIGLRLRGSADPVPALPVGGLYAGSHRGAAAPDAVGAVNFEQGQDATLVAKVGQPVAVWSDYELWWAEGAGGTGRVALSVGRRPLAGQTVAPLASDVQEPRTETGPYLADGALHASVSFDQPGTYALQAVLSTRIAGGDTVASDEDVVPFVIRVVGDPPASGGIRGVVLGDGGLPLEGVTVDVQPVDGRSVAQTRTNADGAYVLEGLPAGPYLAQATPTDLNYLGEWWKEVPSRAGAWPIQVAAGQVVDGINFTLTPGSAIAGCVVDAQGGAIAGVEVTIGPMANAVLVPPPGGAAVEAGVAGRARTNTDGCYAIDRMAAGRYWARAVDPEGRYLPEYFDNKPSLRDADPIGVPEGAMVDGINFKLEAGGAISGRVTAANPAGSTAVGLAGIVVEARSADNPDKALGRAVTGRDGRYRIGGLTPGAYLVLATDPNGHLAPEWWQEAAAVEDADRVAVPDGQAVEGIDFTLGPQRARTRLFVKPAVLGMTMGGSDVLAISVAAVEDLAAFEVNVAWNPEVFEVTGVEITDFLGSTGRRVIPVEPVIDNEHGSLHFGAASVGTAPGPSGDGDLFVMKIAAKAVGETGVEIGASTLTDPEAHLIAHDVSHGRVHVGRCLRGDFDCNCVIDISDVMAVVMRWGAAEGDPEYEAQFDLDGDGDIDIVDVQIEAGLWGKHCDTPVSLAAGCDELGERSEALNRAPGGGAVIQPVMAPDGAALRLSVTPPSASPGAEVAVVVSADEVADLAGFDLAVRYDSRVLALVRAELGSMVTGGGRSFQALGPTLQDGSVQFGAFSFPGGPGPSGAGELALLTFRVMAPGTSAVAVEHAQMVDSTGRAAPAAGYETVFAGDSNRAVFIPTAPKGNR